MKGAKSLHPDENLILAYCSGSPLAKAAVDAWKFNRPVSNWKPDDPRLKQVVNGF